MPAKDPSHKNRRSWNRSSDAYQAAHGGQLGRRPFAWGVWGVAESEVRALGEVADRDVLELGCGAAQFSIALAQRGARPVGLDLSERQLAHARRLLLRAGVGFPLVQGSAERAPFRDGSFDLIFCDHGAMTFARPDRAVAEAARLLRPAGRFAFNMASPLRDLCLDPDFDTVTDRLAIDYFGMERLEDDDEVCFQLPYGGWIRLFRRHGLVVEDLIELRPAAGARTSYPDFAPLDWARRWPGENIWRLSKPPAA